MKYHFFLLLFTFPFVTFGLIRCESIEPILIQEIVPPLTQTSPSNPSPSLTDPSSRKALEEATYREINQYRLSKNLSPLKLNPQIRQQARIHSERMAAGIIPISHENLEQRLKIISFTTPHQKGVENLASHQDNSNPQKSHH